MVDRELLCHGWLRFVCFAIELGPGRIGVLLLRGPSALDPGELGEATTSSRSRPADI
jgi:hypothetical protein